MQTRVKKANTFFVANDLSKRYSESLIEDFHYIFLICVEDLGIFF